MPDVGSDPAGNVTAIDTSLLGHSYYGSNDTVLADLFDLLHEGKQPDQRKWLRAQAFGSQKYWVFQPVQSAARAAVPRGGEPGNAIQ